jgi:hypothetical protein
MQTLIHADMFFVITAVSVVLLTICLIVIAVLVMMILRNVYKISNTVRDETGRISDDIDALRTETKDSGIVGVYKFFKSLFSKKKRRG